MVEVVVDKRELSNFRRRALRRKRTEYFEAVWGYTECGTLYVCAFQPVKHKADADSIEIEDEHMPDFGDKTKGISLLGSIHTHPDSECAPSELDWNAIEPGERFIGILSIERVGKRRKTRLLFYEAREPLPVRTT